MPTGRMPAEPDVPDVPEVPEPGREPGREPFRLGVNYWPSRTALGWWQDFDAAETARDLELMAGRGFDSVRFFLTWEVFQPAPDRVDVAMLDRLVTVADLAERAGIAIMPTLFTGHMSGLNLVPDLGAGRLRSRPQVPGALRRAADRRSTAQLVRRPGRGTRAGVVGRAGRDRPGRPPGAVGVGPRQ